MTTDDLDDTTYRVPNEGPEREQWKITDDRQATWAARKLRGYETERVRLAELFDEEQARLVRQFDDLTHGLKGQIGFFREHLIGYYRAIVQEQGPGTPKTYGVPGAKMQRRKNPDRIEVTDEAAFVGWALDHDHTELLRVAVDKGAVKQAIKDGGLTVPDLTDATPLGSALAVSYERAMGLDRKSVVQVPIPGVAYVVGEESYSATVEP